MRGPERTTKNIINFPMAEKQRVASGVAKDLPALIRPEEPPPQVDHDAHVASGGATDSLHITVSGAASMVDSSASTLLLNNEQDGRCLLYTSDAADE